MPAQITDVNLLQEYLIGVMTRADHHANGVNEVALAIAGGIVWRKDPDPIEVFQRNGDMKNVLWVRISGHRYAFTYDHSSDTIEIRQNSTQGAVLHSLTNQTPLADVRAIFGAL